MCFTFVQVVLNMGGSQPWSSGYRRRLTYDTDVMSLHLGGEYLIEKLSISFAVNKAKNDWNEA